MKFMWLSGKCFIGEFDSYDVGEYILIPIKLPDSLDLLELDMNILQNYDFGHFTNNSLAENDNSWANWYAKDFEFSHFETTDVVPPEWHRFGGAHKSFDLSDFLETVVIRAMDALVVIRVAIRHNPAIGGMGLYTVRKFSKGSIVCHLSGTILDHPTRESIYVDNGQHVVDPYGSYVNHSFEPSTYVDGFDLIALRDLDIDTEVTFNYNESEISMACPFQVDGQWVRGK